jgi:hypothetical protein
MNKASLNKGFNKIFSACSQPNANEIDILWRLVEHNNGKKVLPKLLSYIDERKQYGKRWVESMISTSVPVYFVNGVHDPISGQHMLDYYNDIIPFARTTALDVGHYPVRGTRESIVFVSDFFE